MASLVAFTPVLKAFPFAMAGVYHDWVYTALGAIAGGAETFFGKNKAKSMEGKLALATKISAGVFTLCALIIAVIS